MWRPGDSAFPRFRFAKAHFATEKRTIMRKPMIVKLFIGSLVGFVGAAVLFLVAGGLALWSDSFIMDGPDVVGVRPEPFGWVMIGLAGLAILLMSLASVGLFVAWIGAVVNTAGLTDKTWFIVLLAGGLLSVGFLVTLAYVIAGPEGWRSTVPAQAPAAEMIPPREQVAKTELIHH